MRTQSELYIAALEGNLEKVKTILEKNANDICVENSKKQLPIFAALIITPECSNDIKKQKIEIFKLLWKKDPKTLYHKDYLGETIFHLLASQGNHELLKEVLDACPEGAKIENNYTQYPIHQAILNSRLECVKILLNIQGVVSLIDSKQRLPLHYAVSGSRDMIEACCNAMENEKISFDATDIDGKTAYQIAEERNNTDAIDVLKKHNISFLKSYR